MKTALVLACLLAVALAALHWRIHHRERAAEAAHPPTGDFITVDGRNVHYEIHGTGPDLVMIHGASGNTRDFTFSLVDDLKDRYRVILFDRPGLGWSDPAPGYGAAWSARGEGPRETARILQEAAGEIGVTRPIVLGHSLGGAVAMAWALEAPDTAALVMLAAVSHPWPERHVSYLYDLNGSALGGALAVPLMTAFVPQWYVDRTIGAIFAPQPAPPDYAQAIGTGLILRRDTLRANARQVQNLYDHVVEMAPLYADLRLPIEIVHGDADIIVPLEVHSEPLAQAVASAHLTVLPGIGHMPHHVSPKPVIVAIDRAATRAGLR